MGVGLSVEGERRLRAVLSSLEAWQELMGNSGANGSVHSENKSWLLKKLQKNDYSQLQWSS